MNSDFRSALVAGLIPLDLLVRTMRKEVRNDVEPREHGLRWRWFRWPTGSGLLKPSHSRLK